MATITPLYGAVSNLPFSTWALPHSSTLDFGRQSAVADNTLDDAVDAMVALVGSERAREYGVHVGHICSPKWRHGD